MHTHSTKAELILIKLTFRVNHVSSNITWLHLHYLFHAFLFWNNACSEHSSIKWWVDRVTTLQRHLTRSKMNIQAEPCQLKRSLAADLVVVRHSFWAGSQTRQQTNMQKWSQRKLQVEQQYLLTSWLEKTANKLRWFPLEYIAKCWLFSQPIEKSAHWYK